MNVVVFFSQVEKLKEYIDFASPYSNEFIQFHFISAKLLSDAEHTLLQSYGISISESQNVDNAFSKASEFIGQEQSVITTVDVIPKGNWNDIITSYKQALPDMGTAIGRWYKSSAPGRSNVKSNNMGVKFVDHTPALINDYIIDHAPSSVLHAKKLSRFPVFFNWFSAEMSNVVANGLKESSCFSEFSHFLSDYISSSTSKNSIYYLNKLEIIDMKLMR